MARSAMILGPLVRCCLLQLIFIAIHVSQTCIRSLSRCTAEYCRLERLNDVIHRDVISSDVANMTALCRTYRVYNVRWERSIFKLLVIKLLLLTLTNTAPVQSSTTTFLLCRVNSGKFVIVLEFVY